MRGAGRCGWLAAAAVLAAATPGQAQLNIVLAPDQGLQNNPAALAAFERAAAAWEARLADPVTVNINAGLADLGAGTIGQASTTLVGTGFDVIRNQLVADAADEGANNAIVAALPTASTFTANLPASRTLSGSLFLTRANAKALGFDVGAGADATIQFNSTFTFDYDRSDGISPGATDFETVAAHEIGHALGFVSAVDTANNGGTGAVTPLAKDLFRFADAADRNPTTAADFTALPRELRSSEDAHFDDTESEYRLSRGVNTGLGGDGNQASHWKADEITGVNIGVMDPTLASNQVYLISEADFRVLDLIGYDLVPVPEPAAGLLLAAAGLAGARWRRKA